MDIQTLKYITAVAENGSFTVAAYECGISQSALSKHIQNAENELGGIKLFNRAGRPVTPTIAGQEFIRYAKQITDNYNNMLQSMVKYQMKHENEFTLGVIPVVKRLGLLKLLGEFKNGLDSKYRMRVYDRPTQELTEMLKKEILDAAIVVISPNQPLDPAITYYTLMQNELVLIASRHNHLSDNYAVSLSMLENETFVINDDRTGMYDVVSSALKNVGFEVRNVHMCRSTVYRAWH